MNIIGIDAAPNNIGIALCSKDFSKIKTKCFIRKHSKASNVVAKKNIEDSQTIWDVVAKTCEWVKTECYETPTIVGIELPTYHKNAQTAIMVGMMISSFRFYISSFSDYYKFVGVDPSWIKHGLNIPARKKGESLNQKDLTHISILGIYPFLRSKYLNEHELDAVAVAHHLRDPFNKRISFK